MSIKIIARDDSRKLVLLDGVGFAGTGKWWRSAGGREDREGYATAPQADASVTPDDFGVWIDEERP